MTDDKSKKTIPLTDVISEARSRWNDERERFKASGGFMSQDADKQQEFSEIMVTPEQAETIKLAYAIITPVTKDHVAEFNQLVNHLIRRQTI